MRNEYPRLTATEIVRRVTSKQITAVELTETALDQAETEGRRLNAVTAICRDRAFQQARSVDTLVANGRPAGILAGVPVILKDNIVYRGYPTTCASHMLENYIPPYDATCAVRLEQAGAVIIAKANMDEFAMGSSSETGSFGPVRSPILDDLVPGGSSGGCAALIASGVIPIAYGSDTGGSVRQPAAFCGVVGLKPTYGAVSRYGLVAFGSSLDQIGPMAQNVDDCALALEAVAGIDPHDATSADINHPLYSQVVGQTHDLKYRFGLVREYSGDGIDPEITAAVRQTAKQLSADGHTIIDISLPHAESAIAVYYIIATAEASSNLARYDGIRYGLSDRREQSWKELCAETRGKGFRAEVKRRIILGTFVLSAGYCDRYYQKAQRVRELIGRDFAAAFETVDFVVSPTTPTAAFRSKERQDDPLAMYLSDMLTVPANLAGLPAISIPCGRTTDGRPIGLQLTAPAFGDADLLTAARTVEQMRGT